MTDAATVSLGSSDAFSSLYDDWEVYTKGRPQYPRSLEKLIMNHHRSHHGHFDLADEMGAGGGVFSSVLAKYFKHVHVSDISASAVEAAERHFVALSSDKEQFSFSVAKAEDRDKNVAAASVDMAVMMESAHWTDLQALISSVAKTLAPGGTLAFVYYSPLCMVLDNERVNEAVYRLHHKRGHLALEVGRPSTRRGQMYLNVGLDFVPLPEDIFDRDMTRRIEINTYGRGNEAFRLPGLEDLLNGPDAPAELFAAHPLEKRYVYSELDEEGRGWQQDVPASFFRNEIVRSYIPRRL